MKSTETQTGEKESGQASAKYLSPGGGLTWEYESADRPGLVVSLHDVCPATWERSREMVDDLEAAGVGAISLLVVPHYHKGRKAVEDMEFCGWMKEMAARGHEIVLHGYYHQRISMEILSGWRKWMATYYTAGEGEFFDLGIEEGVELLGRGMGEFKEEFGRAPAGFIAPAWLLRPVFEPVLRELGFRYTTRIDGVYDLARTRFYPAQSLVYSVRAAWRRGCSLGWNSLLAARLEEAPLLRLGLHPPDWEFPAIRRHALRVCERALAARPALTYETWLTAVSALHPPAFSPEISKP